MNTSHEQGHFVVTYRDPIENKVTVLKAKKIRDSTLGLSFIQISDFIFDTGSLVVKPEEEALQKRMENVKSIHLSIYTVLSIEEVGPQQRGLNFERDRSTLIVLPDSPRKVPPPENT